MIKPRLRRGAAVELTSSALKLGWHREHLRRARTILVRMGLIKSTPDGRFVCICTGLLAEMDEEIREQIYCMRLLRDAAAVYAEFITMSKTR
jgi:hypothetical protein